MFSFRLDQGFFTVRGAAVVLRDSHVLLHRCVQDDFWSLPGGRCEFNEPSARCVERELLEELGSCAQAERLLWIAETFYSMGVTPWRESDPLVTPFHEICFYHLVGLDPADPVMLGDGPFNGREGALHLEFRWFQRDSLVDVRLYPRFLVGALRHIPETTIHVVEREET